MSGADAETVRAALERAGTNYVKEGDWPKDVIYADPKEGVALAALERLVARVAEAEKARDEQYERYLAVESRAIFHDDAMARAAEAEKALAEIEAECERRAAIGGISSLFVRRVLAGYSGGAVQTGDTGA